MRARRSLCTAVLLSCAISAQANPISDWNAIALRLVDEEQRAQAVRAVHVAMFETLNFIEGRYVTAALVPPPGAVRVSAEAAAAVAAHAVLLRLYPDKERVLDEALESSLERIPEGARKEGAKILARALVMNLHALGAGHTFAGHGTTAMGRDLLEESRLHAQVWDRASRWSEALAHSAERAVPR